MTMAANQDIYIVSGCAHRNRALSAAVSLPTVPVDTGTIRRQGRPSLAPEFHPDKGAEPRARHGYPQPAQGRLCQPRDRRELWCSDQGAAMNVNPPLRFRPAGDCLRRAEDRAGRTGYCHRRRRRGRCPTRRIWCSPRYWAKMGEIVMMDAMLSPRCTTVREYPTWGLLRRISPSVTGISRETQDALAVEGHRRAANAIAEGYFRNRSFRSRSNAQRGVVAFGSDEHVR